MDECQDDDEVVQNTIDEAVVVQKPLAHPIIIPFRNAPPGEREFAEAPWFGEYSGDHYGCIGRRIRRL